MTRTPSGALVVSLLLGILLAPAEAADWRIDHGKSTLGFTASYDEIEFDGRFETFNGEIRFDPDALRSSSFKVSATIESVNTESPDRDEGMLEQDWFNATTYPTADFVSDGFEKSKQPAAFRVAGNLTIKGKQRPVIFDFNWDRIDNSARLQGHSVVNRNDFHIGTGDWADDDTIGFAVTISFDLHLTRSQ